MILDNTNKTGTVASTNLIQKWIITSYQYLDYVYHSCFSTSCHPLLAPCKFIPLICISVLLLVSQFIQPLLADPISATDKYAWSENAGWQDFHAAHAQAKVYDDHLEGYVWSEAVGWIRLGSYTGGDAHTYANDAANTYGVNNDGKGNLSGYAWSENAGWINFNPNHSQVTIDSATGDFDGYAWSESLGWIHFQNDNPAYKVRRELSTQGYAPVISSSGSNYFVDNTTLANITDKVNTSGMIYTATDAALQIDLGDELCGISGAFELNLDPGSIVGLNRDNNGFKIIQLHRGSLRIRLSANACTSSKVKIVTNHVNIQPVVANSGKQLRVATELDYDTDFVVSYAQDGLQGTTNIDVNQGSLSVNQHGDTVTDQVASNVTYTDIVPRTTWVLPMDNSNVVGGKTNNFIWMQYPGASGYLFEYKFPAPSFAQDNANAYEDSNQVIHLKNSQLTLLDDLVIIQVDFPEFSDELKQKKVETRMFVTDENGQIMPDSLSSDKTTLGFE